MNDLQDLHLKGSVIRHLPKYLLGMSAFKVTTEYGGKATMTARCAWGEQTSLSVKASPLINQF